MGTSGTMDVRVGLLILFVLGAGWVCDARHVVELSLSGKI